MKDVLYINPRLYENTPKEKSKAELRLMKKVARLEAENKNLKETIGYLDAYLESLGSDIDDGFEEFLEKKLRED